MNDHFKSLSVDEKFVTKVEGLSLEEKIDFDRGRWMKGEITMGKNYYADLRRLYSNEETPFRSIKVMNADESDDEDLENALFQSSKHLAEYDPLYLWLALEKLPNQKNAAGLMKCFVTFDPYAGQGKNELFLRTLRWCKVVEFDTKYPEIWRHVAGHFDRALDKSWTLMKSQGVSVSTWWHSVKTSLTWLWTWVHGRFASKLRKDGIV